MKHIILSALLLAAMASGSCAICNDSINKQVAGNFQRQFPNALDVKWIKQNQFLKATFKQDGQTLFAYYNNDGEQVAVSRRIQIAQLPMLLINDLKKVISHQLLTELFEVSANSETAYFATVTGNTHVSIFRAEPSGNWTIFKRKKRIHE